MDIEKIKALAEIMNDNRLTSLEVCEGETSVKLKKETAAATPLPTIAKPSSSGAPVSAAIAAAGGREIKAPMVGVFYASATPEEDAFVSVGSSVKKGDTVCIIEAMKLMNEIAADCDGEIVEICAENEQVVEYGQPLFKVR